MVETLVSLGLTNLATDVFHATKRSGLALSLPAGLEHRWILRGTFGTRTNSLFPTSRDALRFLGKLLVVSYGISGRLEKASDKAVASTYTCLFPRRCLQV